MISASQLRTYANLAIAYMILFAFLGIYSCVSESSHIAAGNSVKISTSTQVVNTVGVQHRKR